MEVNKVRRKRVDVDTLWLRLNPTSDDAIAQADSGQAASSKGFVPPPDQEWLPQLHATYKSVAAVARIAGLSVRECRRKLVEYGVEVKTYDRRTAS